MERSSRRRGKGVVHGAARVGGSGKRALGHLRVRTAHSSEIAEDYVEAIAEIIARHGKARVTDLTQHFGVSHVTVSRTIARLKRAGLVESAPHGPVNLTSAGAAMARDSRRRHVIVTEFLIALGIDPSTAHCDAEGIEHHVSPTTLRVLEKHTETLKRNSGR